MKKVELARSELDSVDNHLKVSNEWRPIYEYVLKTIELLAQAYNAECGKTIEVNFSPLPPNLFSEDAHNYDGKVAFPNKAVWHIKFSSSKPHRKENTSSMIIGFSMDGDRFNYDSMLLISRLGENLLNINLDGPSVPPIAEGIERVYPLESYRDSLKTIVRSLFESQLLQD